MLPHTQLPINRSTFNCYVIVPEAEFGGTQIITNNFLFTFLRQIEGKRLNKINLWKCFSDLLLSILYYRQLKIDDKTEI